MIYIYDDEIVVSKSAEGRLTGREIEEIFMDKLCRKYVELTDGLRSDSEAGTLTFIYDNDIEGLKKATLLNTLVESYEDLFEET